MKSSLRFDDVKIHYLGAGGRGFTNSKLIRLNDVMSPRLYAEVRPKGASSV